MIPGTPASGRLAMVTAVAGTVLIAAGAFWLSFTALADLARRSGVNAGQAWAWPVIVDGLIVVATVAVVALAGQRTAWYPWGLLAGGALISVTANALHAVVAADADMPGVLAACVAAVPPLVLLASTHLTVVLVRSQHSTPVAELALEPADSAVSDAAEARDPMGRRGVAARLRVEGWSNKQIARHLGVAPSTVGRWFAHPALAAGAPALQETAEELSE
ncbi:Homeodomain-like domain-containing protein [Propionibacterium cyclohexanicum]|uniref:Homeodomain-like domain-containing protein n=1 Tax=Propionibacterium cyclohexanicum TaxID=64702 RepID=A0A1H9T5M3_9ACTN|nr:DUF2637 domain-containing protein [Propionibacterium cyclohexanicum]SER92560.1 Homeodomain-like domain-containing protein [Propionibacterium cyclohexanicum]